jgi:molybdate transport system ATP-binding protein
MSGLVAKLVASRASGFVVEVDIEIPPGATVALLGPNGAGKSTLVEALAGLLPIVEGSIRLGGLVLDSPADDRFVPPEDRKLGVVFQDYLLFPHMTALDNVSFGLRAKSETKASASPIARSWLEKLGIVDLAEKMASDLSGGEAQRVALARALATDPSLLLLDEPMSALDATTRVEVRRELADALEAFTGPRLLITHDPTEAFLLADEVYVMEEGLVTQRGSAEEIRLRPRTPYAADLAGANLFRGVADRGLVNIGGHILQAATLSVSGDVLAIVHPRAISVHRERPEGSPRNVWETEVTRIENYGDRVRLQTGLPLNMTAEITPRAVEDLSLATGTKVWVSIKATEIGLQEG